MYLIFTQSFVPLFIPLSTHPFIIHSSTHPCIFIHPSIHPILVRA